MTQLRLTGTHNKLQGSLRVIGKIILRYITIEEVCYLFSNKNS